jgi:hypothetical protein
VNVAAGIVILALSVATFSLALRLTPSKLRRMRVGLGGFDFVGYLPLPAARAVCVLTAFIGVAVGIAAVLGRIR